MPIDQPSALEELETGMLFNDAKGKKDKRWEGSPHHLVWAAIVSSLVQEERTQQTAKEVLRLHAATNKKPRNSTGRSTLAWAAS